jgi:hypothetical protein
MRDRRQFLQRASIALGTVTAGGLRPLNAGAIASAAPGSRPGQKSAGFGWEVSNLDNNGANVFFEVMHRIVLQSLSIDVAFMITSAPPTSGFAEVLCRAGVSRGAPPSFSSGPQGYPEHPASADFGEVKVSNPNGLSVGFDGVLLQDAVCQVILKTWVPLNGVASAASRNVQLEPFLDLNTGDFLVYHMDHAGVPGDAEMQVALRYIVQQD